MDENNKYKEQIIQMLQKINEEKFLRYLYTLLNEMLIKQSEKE